MAGNIGIKPGRSAHRSFAQPTLHESFLLKFDVRVAAADFFNSIWPLLDGPLLGENYEKRTLDLKAIWGVGFLVGPIVTANDDKQKACS